MRVSRFVNCFLAAAVGLSIRVSAQVSGTYTDPASGITFATTFIDSSQTAPGFTLGIALPPTAATVSSNDYIGLIIGGVTDGAGWSGISHGGGMPNSLLLMVWPYGDTVFGSFRYADAYVAPDLYTGNATFSTISTTVNSTHYTITYLCKNCFDWDQDGAVGSQATDDGVLILGWCQASVSPPDPSDPTGPIVIEHDLGQGIFGAPVAPMLQSSYSQWATKTQSATSVPTTKPTSTSTGTGTVTVTATATSVSFSSTPVPTATYDYIVVGAGAGGIPMADKLSQAGHSVLLIERGPPSSGRWGGTTQGGSATKSDWLIGTNLTRFDVPGLCNEIWHDATGISCPDMDQMAGCVLGGGTAVNAGLWWNPNPIDWDYNFPTGWHSTDVAAATSRVFSRIPGTDIPSADGQLYLQNGYNVLTSGLETAGWTYVTANSVPGQKNRTYAHTPYMFSHGERGGPMATYLVTASARSNFRLWMNTTVDKVIRTGGHITGVQVEAYGNGGYKGVVNLTPTTGRVILSAGTFGSAKILLRSGIGPLDQLAVVNASTDGPTMIGSQSWIDLPVGYNLDDHCNTDTVISHPNVTFYDFYAAFQTPIPSDEQAYLTKRDGIFTQAAPNIGPMIWDGCTNFLTPLKSNRADGIVRQLQWTARCEGSDGAPDNHSMTISQYLGRGATSRGRATITPSLSMTVSTLPYLQNANDVAAVITGIEHLQSALSTVKGLTWLVPPPNTTATEYVNNLPIVTSTRTANHWIGTAKIGSDDGRQGGTAVVDLNAKVWGTDNLFVVDGSIFPGEPSTNPSALIVIAAEHASDLILALAPPQPVVQYSICGGITYSGSSVCASPFKCTYVNAYYWQCL